jgi:hypothetical protein
MFLGNSVNVSRYDIQKYREKADRETAVILLAPGRGDISQIESTSDEAGPA